MWRGLVELGVLHQEAHIRSRSREGEPRLDPLHIAPNGVGPDRIRWFGGLHRAGTYEKLRVASLREDCIVLRRRFAPPRVGRLEAVCSFHRGDRMK